MTEEQYRALLMHIRIVIALLILVLIIEMLLPNTSYVFLKRVIVPSYSVTFIEHGQQHAFNFQIVSLVNH